VRLRGRLVTVWDCQTCGKEHTWFPATPCCEEDTDG
jgi:hypothetical protein